MSSTDNEEKVVDSINEAVADTEITPNEVKEAITTAAQPDVETPPIEINESPTNASKDEQIPEGFTKLDDPDPAVEQLYDEGLGEEGPNPTNTLTEPLLPNSGESNGSNEENEGCCAKMKKYKGVWFLLLTLLVLAGIATGIVLGAKSDDDDDSDETYSPTKAPIPSPTKAPTNRSVPTLNPTATTMPTASGSGGVIPNGMKYCVDTSGEVDVNCSHECSSGADCSFGLTCMEHSAC